MKNNQQPIAVYFSDNDFHRRIYWFLQAIRNFNKQTRFAIGEKEAKYLWEQSLPSIEAYSSLEEGYNGLGEHSVEHMKELGAQFCVGVAELNEFIEEQEGCLGGCLHIYDPRIDYEGNECVYTANAPI